MTVQPSQGHEPPPRILPLYDHAFGLRLGSRYRTLSNGATPRDLVGSAASAMRDRLPRLSRSAPRGETVAGYGGCCHH
jgi:hypothetical protein